MKKLIIFSSIFILGILFTAAGSDAGVNHIANTGADSSQVCIVTGEEFPMDAGIKYKYLNKEVTFCCGGCVKSFQKEPANYIKDGLRCPVCDDDDGKKELSHVHDGIKYYFCGTSCKGKFEKDAQKYIDNYSKQE